MGRDDFERGVRAGGWREPWRDADAFRAAASSLRRAFPAAPEEARLGELLARLERYR